MMHMLRSVSVIAAVLLLDACASQLSYSEMQALMPQQPADKGRIYFYRESAWMGNLITPDIMVNGAVVGISTPGTFFYVDRDPGAYQVSCGAGTLNQTSFSLAAGQDVYVRTKVGSGSIVKSTMVSEVVELPAAIPAIHDLKYASVK